MQSQATRATWKGTISFGMVNVPVAWADEVRAADALNAGIEATASEEELDMAGKLIEAMTKTSAIIDEQEDGYREALLELVDMVIDGKVVKLPKTEKPKAGANLMDALRASVEKAEKVAA